MDYKTAKVFKKWDAQVKDFNNAGVRAWRNIDWKNDNIFMFLPYDPKERGLKGWKEFSYGTWVTSELEINLLNYIHRQFKMSPKCVGIDWSNNGK